MDPVTLEGLRNLISLMRERADDPDSYFGENDERLMRDGARVIELFIQAALGDD